jgi:hypothetical protein
VGIHAHNDKVTLSVVVITINLPQNVTRSRPGFSQDMLYNHVTDYNSRSELCQKMMGEIKMGLREALKGMV